MTPEEIDYMLITGCPTCSADIRVEDLCPHDDPLYGPICLKHCCTRLHYGMAAA